MTIYYKAFKKDMTCRGLKFEEGKIYKVEGKPILCKHGFHFCKDLVLTLAYYPVNTNINENCYAEVEVLGDVEFEHPTKHKGVTNKIKILRIIPCDEITNLVDNNRNSGSSNSGSWNSGSSNSGYRNSGSRNSGSWNSGSSNSGSWNSGSRNSGSRNSGSWNSGSSNSGDWNSGSRNSGSGNSGSWNSGSSNSGSWNSGNYEAGCFNSKESGWIRVFNKRCSKRIWDDAYKPDFLYFDIDSSIGYKKSFQKSWNNADKDDRIRIKDLPNFNADVFYKISGIDLRSKNK